jgi:hypothetical protein
VADAGDDNTIREGAIGALDGTNSYDGEGNPITFEWTQVAGPLVNLYPDNLDPQPSFTSPLGLGTELVFKLQVSDGMETSMPSAGVDSSAADTVKVTVIENSPPIANAGSEQTKDEGSIVTMNGSVSSDPDGDNLTFSWTQIAGPEVTLDDSNSATPSFTAPAVDAGGADLQFELSVTDNYLPDPKYDTDHVIIHVTNFNDPPKCDLAVAAPNALWPPDHKMQDVIVTGISDPQSDAVSTNITGITQDEPINGTGDGDTGPDAVVQAEAAFGSVLIRAERDGSQNGRIYRINFIAGDGFESCLGVVEVAVPHQRKAVAIDDGQQFTSTQP